MMKFNRKQSLEPKVIYKSLLFLSMLYVSLNMASNIVGYKVVALGSLTEPGGVFIFPVTYVIADIISEVYGYGTIRFVIWFGLICDFLSSIAMLLVIHMHSPSYWHHQSDYNNVLGSILRLNMAGLLGRIVGSFTNVYAISKWKILMKGRFFALRSILSSAIGEWLYLLIAGFIVFYGVYSIKKILLLILSDYLVKIVYAFVLAFPASFFSTLIKKVEKVDVYDYETNFNPIVFGRSKND